MKLTNDFHHTEVVIRPTWKYGMSGGPKVGLLTSRQVRRAWGKLCDREYCSCQCGLAGEKPACVVRGPHVQYEADREYYVAELSNEGK